MSREQRHSCSLVVWLMCWFRLVSSLCLFTINNGTKSGMLPVSFGIPQGSVLGPTLFTLFTNDLPVSVKSGSVYMYADDTTVFCLGHTADEAIANLNKALQELYTWCLVNRLTPHPGKSEAMLISRGSCMGPIARVFIGNSTLKWVIPKHACWEWQ